MIRLSRAAIALFFAAALAFCPMPALAQFLAQQTYVASSSGAANAFSITVPNITSAGDLVGVPIRVLMSASNSSASTLTVSNGASNVLSNVTILKPSTSGLTILIGNEIRAGQISTLIYDGTVFELQSPALSLATTQAQNGYAVPTNLQFAATVGSNQLTISVLAATSGAAPNTANPVLVPFRDVTIANGDPVWLSLTSALSFTINSGNTMGCQSATMCRLWLFLANDAGTVRLCAYNARNVGAGNTSVIGINEAVLQTSQAGSVGGSTTQALYCNAAITSKAVRYAGYVDIQEGVAGTWQTGPTYVQLFGPGVQKPGEVVQRLWVTSTTSVNNSTASFVQANPIVTISPTAAANVIVARAGGSFTNNAGVGFGAIADIFRNSSVELNAQQQAWVSGGPSPAFLATEVMDAPNTTSATTYSLGFKIVNGGTVTWAVPSSYVVIEEIQG